MNTHNIWKIIEEGILPLLLYGAFTVICFLGGINAIRRKRSFRRDGRRVEAEILHYNTEIKQSRFHERIHIITLQCVSPVDNNLHTYTLITNASKAHRYKDIARAEVFFIPDESLPVLKEDMIHIGIDGALGIFGSVFCGLFTLLLLVAFIAYFFLK